MNDLKQSIVTAFLGTLGINLFLKFPHIGETFATLFTASYLNKTLRVKLQNKIDSGTTPYNPLKIPSKKITPIKS